MAVEIHNGRLYCTTSETFFGPQCRDDKECEELAWHAYRINGTDVRNISEQLDFYLEVHRDFGLHRLATHSSLYCKCGSGKMYTMKTYLPNGNIETCCEKCKAK